MGQFVKYKMILDVSRCGIENNRLCCLCDYGQRLLCGTILEVLMLGSMRYRLICKLRYLVLRTLDWDCCMEVVA